MKIGIVNDVALAAEALRRAVTADGAHEVVWVAENGKVAVEHCIALRPDLVLMDLIMPEMDGVEATRQIMARAPCAILVVTASVEGHAAQVFAAMGAGALDATNTPILGPGGAGEGREALLQKIRLLELLIKPRAAAGTKVGDALPAPRAGSNITLVAIGASSGGPSALAEILGRLDRDFPAPIVVVQHVDAQFAREFAHWLAGQTALHVATVRDAVVPRPGTVYVAELDNHLVMDEGGWLTYATGPTASFYRPSVDVFFDSVQRHLRGACVAVLLTGMGRDGANGLLNLRRGGHVTVAQDQATSAVFGMPRAAAEIGAAEHIMGLGDIASFIDARARAPRRAGNAR
jgi:chemotaxis response regulator CheB